MRLLASQLLYFPACEGFPPAVSHFNSLPCKLGGAENTSNDLSEVTYTPEVVELGLKSAGTRSTASCCT